MHKDLWFKDWFDTEYYHLLYNKRNEDEACEFINKLMQKISFPITGKAADIACGKGRYSRVLANLGFEVYGYDLSPKNIGYAKSMDSKGTHFNVHDIREPYKEMGFSLAVNLFTSFGYFDATEDDALCIANIHAMLEVGGFFVQDYINGGAFLNQLPMSGSETRSNIRFNYTKTYEQPFILKEITVQDGEQNLLFTEKIKVFSLEELTNLHKQCGFEVVETFGDYRLSVYKKESSPRIIIISKKSD